MATSARAEWSDTEILTLLELVEAGNSYSLCAHILSEMGFPPRTKNACIGMAYRVWCADQEAHGRAA